MIPLVGATGIVGRLILDGTLDQERAAASSGQGAGAPSRTRHMLMQQRSQTVITFPADRSAVERYPSLRRRHHGAGLHHRADSACRTIACRVPWRGEDHL
jgi:hypothetical protein